MRTSSTGQHMDYVFDIELDELPAAQAVEVAVRRRCHAIIPGNAITDIHLFSQSYLADQFQVAPDCAIPNRAVPLTYLVVQLIDGNVLP